MWWIETWDLNFFDDDGVHLEDLPNYVLVCVYE